MSSLLRILMVCLFLTLSVCAQNPERRLEVGDQAPDFNLPGSDGHSYSVSQFRGQKPVVIAWFPKAFTGG